MDPDDVDDVDIGPRFHGVTVASGPTKGVSNRRRLFLDSIESCLSQRNLTPVLVSLITPIMTSGVPTDRLLISQVARSG